MASKDKRKSDKKGSKRIEENVAANKSNAPEANNDEVSSAVEFSVLEDVSVAKESAPEQSYYEEPVLTELIVARYIGEKVKGLYEGQGEAYFVDGHCYRGNFSEGYMHGRGTYVWADGVIYEGDFLKNQVTGKGKYTWSDESIYVGDVLNGKRHGYGTFRNQEGTLSYTGDWYCGTRHGKGRMNYDLECRSFYEGGWMNGVKHGWGTRQYPSGNVYHGMWFNNVRHGEGTMKWLDRDQLYIGQWENGIQHGMGQHIWLLRRVLKSQYSMRNMYYGEMVYGKRHGEGVFYYANGAKYEGLWKNNMKHGKGKFTFKNGRIYEGMFENDHIVEYPEFFIDGDNSPDLSKIRTRTPVPADAVSIHSNESKNTVSPSFQLDINLLLASLSSDDQYEANQVLFAVTRYVSALHRIYTFYSSLGYQESPDNTFVMSKMQFWVFLKDIHMHHGCHTLTEMDRVIGANYQKSHYELHNPYEKILQRQFINYLIIISHLQYSKDYYENKETGPLLEYCFSRLMGEKVLCRACRIQSPIYVETRRAVNALVHMDQAYGIYQTVSTQRKRPPKEPVLKMRQFLLLLKDLHLINEDLTSAAVIQVLHSVNPTLSDGEGSYNLELEMTFLEFFEALIGCAERYVTEQLVLDATTPGTSVDMTTEQSMQTVPESSSVITSQNADEEVESLPVTTMSAHAANQQTSVSSSAAINLKFLLQVDKEEDIPSKTIQDPSQLRPSFYLKETASRKLSTFQKASMSRMSSSKMPDSRRPSSMPETSKSLVEPSQLSLQETASGMNRKGERQSAIDEQSLSTFPRTFDEAEDAEELIPEIEEAIEEEATVLFVDDETRQFNFWTHQIHIFFVRKFFPHMERHIEIKKRIEARILEEARQKLAGASDSDVTMVASEFESEMMDSNTDLAEGDDDIEELEKLLENVI
ncbi:hypothetical protein BsWGS_02965 [Bradybaena similaris]